MGQNTGQVHLLLRGPAGKCPLQHWLERAEKGHALDSWREGWNGHMGDQVWGAKMKGAKAQTPLMNSANPIC